MKSFFFFFDNLIVRGEGITLLDISIENTRRY